MAARIGAFEPRGLYPSVNLGARYARVPEQLLDRAQIGAAVEQVGGEAVAQRVRGDRAGVARGVCLHARGPRAKAPPDVARAERAPGLREEHRVGADRAASGAPLVAAFGRA